MTLEGAKKFIAALKSAGIKKYQFDTDLGTHYYNNDNAVNVLDESLSMVYNFRRGDTTSTPVYDEKILVLGSDLSDIHEARTSGNYEQIKKFIDAYGLNLNDDQLKVILNIDKHNYSLKPETGDYNNFKILSSDEIAKLSPVEKAQYEAELEEYNKPKLPDGVSAQLTI